MRGSERHLQLLTPFSLRFLQAIELTISSHDPPTGRRAHLDAHAQECRMDAPLTQERILLELANRVADLECDLARPFPGSGFFFQARNTFLRPTFQRSVDGWAAHFEIGANRGNGPTFCVE